MKTIICSLFLCAQVFFAQAVLGQQSLGVVRHNHLALHVKDIQASTQFYKEVLGLKSIPVPDNLKAIRSWFDVGEGQQIHLLAGRNTEFTHDKNGSHIALFVADIAQSEAFLKQRAITYHKQVRFDGVVQIYFPDPDGYLFELNELKK
ncbi:glyoxalase [Rudanella paleaurantiibacter]|uniref:Glyoxalase n=1 Tax=Rudanella paleaurantiibacter TaxID=2614655 RepID=A0A7J5TXK2_9BACT|nr:VOC family protein [Rudanella paleaurantiibacter]KAB7729153.1 glyoxalase [Rudanella paleaurantiibacter]